MKKKYHSDVPAIDVAATGRNLKAILKFKGLSTPEVAVFLGLGTPQSIYHWFAGRNLPSIDSFYALSYLLNIPVDQLIVGNIEKLRLGPAKSSRLQAYLKGVKRIETNAL